MKKTVSPLTGILTGRIVAPASKSYAQRALAASMLVPSAAGESLLDGMSLCNDTSAALKAVQELGAEVSVEGENLRTYRVRGGFLAGQPAEIHIGESGLATRLFTPIVAQSPRPVTVTGHGSILRRPVGAMQGPLEALGASVSLTDGNFLPLTVSGPLRGGSVEVDGSLSSQFITGLLMSLPLSASDTRLLVQQLRSVPYVEMTLEVLEAFGIQVEHTPDYSEFTIPGRQSFRPARYTIEGDWSGASCPLVAGAIAGSVTVANLNPASRQADRAILDALERAGARVRWESDRTVTVAEPESGALRGFEFDATDSPDLFPALAVLASFCEGKTTVRGTGRLTHKESDRAAAIVAEFARLGVEIDISRTDIMVITGTGNRTLSVRDTHADSHNDHRIAMAVAVAALRADRPVEIARADAVDKSYPAFWDDLDRMRTYNAGK